MRILGLAALTTLITTSAHAELIEAPSFDRSELSVVRTHTQVDVAGVVARVVIRQTYFNASSRAIDATYVFPASTHAAVDGLTMHIGDRRIEAKVQPRAKARATFERAKAEGKTATLLEQHRPNVFQSSLSNVMPGDRIDVELRYTELLVPEERVYEIVLPQIVAERFGEAPWGGATDRTPRSRVHVDIDAGMPIREVHVASHDAPATVRGAKATARIDAPGGFAEDVVVRYRLDGDHVQTGVLLDERTDGGHFLFMMQPPERVAPNAVPPREYVFVVDVSGSMNGFPLDVAAHLLERLVDGLGPMDRFNVVCFASSNSVLYERSKAATPETLREAIRFLRSHPSGGTQLGGALKRALDFPRDEGVSTNFVVITDGFITAERSTFELIRDHRGNANVFALGIGTNVNRYLVEGIAKAGGGHPFIVTSEADAEHEAQRLLEYIESPVLADIRVAFDGFDAYDLEPPTVPDLFADRPIVVLGKYRGAPKGRITVTGHGGGAKFARSMTLERTGDRNEAIAKLWARSRIDHLTLLYGLGRDTSVGEQIEKLGLEHNLLTERTSFVAVDSRVRNAARPRTVANVPPSQGFGSVSATPELDPSAAAGALLLLAGLIAMRLDRRRRSE